MTVADRSASRRGSTSTPRPLLECLELQHINIVTHGFDETVDHFHRVFGAQYVRDIPADQWHAGLIYFGNVLFELFVPHEFLANARYGPHYVGLEYQVPDVAEARDRLRERGIGLIRDIGIAIHTDPAETFGVAFELYDHSFFHDSPIEWIEPLAPPEHWRDEHPLGCTGLRRWSAAVRDHDAALAFYRDVLGAEATYEERRPAIDARVTVLQLADTVIELLTPTGDGVIQRHLDRWGDGIRSVVLGVRDLDQAIEHLAHHGITTEPGDHPDTIAIRPADNRGVMMELST